MRFLAWLVGIPVAILAILFAVSNRDPVTIGIWPFTEGVTAPSFVVALVPFALGLILGAGFAGIGTVRARWRHRGAARQVGRMQREMEEMRARHQRQSQIADQNVLAPPRDTDHESSIETKAHP
jgi:uncharacterized integral membrane protein